MSIFSSAKMARVFNAVARTGPILLSRDETARFIGECIFHGIIEFVASVSQPSFNSLKPNRLESRRKSMATHLRGLATTCVGFTRTQIRSQVDASFSPFGHPTSTQIDRKVNCICVKFAIFSNLRELASRLANPFGHPSQVRTQVLVLLRFRGDFTAISNRLCKLLAIPRRFEFPVVHTL